MQSNPNNPLGNSVAKSLHSQNHGKISVDTPQRAFQHANESGLVETANFWRKEIEFREHLNIGEEFWFDLVTRLKREKRYLEAAIVCRREIPLPAAYEHLLICLRKLRSPDIGRVSYRLLLRELYTYAVEFDAMYRIPHVEYQTSTGKRSCTGFNVVSILWGSLVERPLCVNYDEIGFEQVAKLNQTDRRCLVDEFGTPRTHSDPFLLIKPYWEKAVIELARRQEKMDQEFSGELRATQAERSKSRSWLRRLLGIQ